MGLQSCQKFRSLIQALLGCLCFCSILAEAEILDPTEVLGPYDRSERALEARLQSIPGERLLDKIDSLSGRRKIEEDEAYILFRLKFRELDRLGRVAEVLEMCPFLKPDDYEKKALCLYLKRDMRSRASLEQVYDIFDESLLATEGTLVPARVAIVLLNFAYEMSELGKGREIYQKALLVTPPEARKSRLDLLWNAANIYTAPLNSLRIQREGMILYDQLEKVYKSDPDSRSLADMIAFNKGVTQLTVFRDYDAALNEFGKISKDSPAWTSTQVFKSWAYLRLNQKDNAKETIDSIDLDNYEDLIQLASLRCYEAMTRHGLHEANDLSPCLNLKVERSNSDLMYQITRDLIDRSLSPEVELQLLRNFWRAYEAQIMPHVQQIMENNSNTIELARVRAENLVKSMDMKHYQLLKLVAAGLVIGLFLTIFMLWQLRNKNRSIEKLQSYIRKAVLARFLPPIIIEEIIQGRSRLEAKPKDELITLIFCDIVGFTSMCSQIGGERTAELLNEFMQIATDVIYQHQGTIDKFIGDAVMVIFGAPTPLPPDIQAQRAVACAVDLLRSMHQFPQIELRIGINQGHATVGIFGNEKRSDFTAIGPTVNLASRIERSARAQEILVSGSVASHLPAHFIEDHGLFALRGIPEPVRLYKVSANEILKQAS